jgi:small conductance mechanosensitive channel
VNIVVTFAGIAGIIASFVLLNGLIQLSSRVLAATWLRHYNSTIINVRQNVTVTLLVTCVALCVLVAGVNGVLIFQGKSVSAFYLDLLGSIPHQFWIQLAIALLKCISLLLLVKLSLPYLLKALDQVCILAQNSDKITANDESVQVFFSTLKKVSTNGIWLLALIFCSDFLQAPAIIIKYLRVGLKAYLAISLGRLIIKLLSVSNDDPGKTW